MIDQLHYISQEKEGVSHLTSIKKALDAGCKWVQLRIKNESELVILKNAVEASKLCRDYAAKLIINDYPHIALESGADGIHLGLNDMEIKKARELLGSQMIIGGTANTFEDIRQRASEGVDYIGLGPYRFTATKKNLSPILGINGYKRIMENMRDNNITIPVIAIGGIRPEDIPLIMQTEVHGIAMSGAITNIPDQKSMVEEIYRLMTRRAINNYRENVENS